MPKSKKNHDKEYQTIYILSTKRDRYTLNTKKYIFKKIRNHKKLLNIYEYMDNAEFHYNICLLNFRTHSKFLFRIIFFKLSLT